MTTTRPPRPIRSKISTMPRKQSVTEQIETTEQSIQNLRTANPPSLSLAKKPDSPKTVAHSSNDSSNFQTFYLEY